MAAAAAAAAKTDASHDSAAGMQRSARAFFWQAPGLAAPYVIALIIVAAWGATTATTTSVQGTLLFLIGAVPAAIVLAASYQSTSGAAPPKTSATPLSVMRAHPEYVAFLLGTGGTWMLYDVSFYGITIFTTTIVAGVFGVETLTALLWQSAIVSCIGIPASALAVYMLPRLGARLLCFYGFLTNLASFLALGLVYGSFPSTADQQGLKFALFCIAMFSISWGPNVATYVCPVQVYPASVRSTFHGLSAAAGKVGAVIGAFLFPLMVTNMPLTGFWNGTATVFLIQVVVSALGAVLAWFCLPDHTNTFHPRFKSSQLLRSLRALAIVEDEQETEDVAAMRCALETPSHAVYEYERAAETAQSQPAGEGGAEGAAGAAGEGESKAAT